MKNNYPSYMQNLNTQQWEAVLHTDSPLLILAGAGSGKTRVIITKIAYLIEQLGTAPRQILAVTFTNKAAEEMKTRLHELTPAAEGVMIKTFHSFGAWLLRRYAHHLGLKNNFLIYDEDDMCSLLRGIFPQKRPKNELKQIANQISRAKNLFLTPGDDLRAITWDADFAQTYSSYQQSLNRSGNLDFGDLIIKSVHVLRECPAVRDEIQDRFKIILVDEYQDSNLAQFELLKALYNKKNYICVVGDDDQSIYGFRGAQVGNILNYPEFFPNTRIIKLEQNYRSTANILQAASSVVANNKNRLGKSLHTEKGDGKPIVLAFLQDNSEEGAFCARIVRQGKAADTAILYRMNYQSRHFEELFSRWGIPYQVVGTQRFYQREEIKDVLAYLCLLINPLDEVSLSRIINKPARGIGKKSVQNIFNKRKDQANLFLLLQESMDSVSASAARGIKGLIKLFDNLNNTYQSITLSELMQKVIINSGLFKYYRKKDLAEGTFKCKNLEELVSAALPYKGGRAGLTEFLQNVMLNNNEDTFPGQKDRVTLITVHNTKGLEFERVILTGLEQGIFPATGYFSGTELDDQVDEDRIEEERRLFYVAVTRAKSELYLTTCTRRTIFGRVQPAKPSLFLREIPQELLEIYGKQENNDGYPIGCIVYHDDYGYGVVSAKESSQSGPLVTVRFETGRQSKFILKYAQLQRIETPE